MNKYVVIRTICRNYHIIHIFAAVNFLIVPLQKIIEDYYNPKYYFSNYVKQLEQDKIIGDELTLVLLACFLKRNVTIMAPNNMWAMYQTLKQDIILAYDGRFAPTQDLSASASSQSKLNESLMKLFLNIK